MVDGEGRLKKGAEKGAIWRRNGAKMFGPKAWRTPTITECSILFMTVSYRPWGTGRQGRGINVPLLIMGGEKREFSVGREDFLEIAWKCLELRMFPSKIVRLDFGFPGGFGVPTTHSTFAAGAFGDRGGFERALQSAAERLPASIDD